MDNSRQQEFIGRIRSALGHAPDEWRSRGNLCTSRFTDETGAILDRIKNRSAADMQQLIDRLLEMAAPINLKVTVLNDRAAVTAAVADLVRDTAPEFGDQKQVVMWQHPLLASLGLAETLASQNVLLHVTEFENSATDEDPAKQERERIRKNIIDSYIGITSADFCMAETATLVMRTRPGQARSVSLVPSIHVAVITLDQVIADLKELYALLKWDPEAQKEGLTNCMTFISGPSKTADVEATMVHGAHGPREVHVYVMTG
ncbi:MAG: lactate utilization protein [Desulfobacterales bacterium]|jgi:L-lactate dehydrogenase complex protein LldG